VGAAFADRPETDQAATCIWIAPRNVCGRRPGSGSRWVYVLVVVAQRREQVGQVVVKEAVVGVAAVASHGDQSLLA